MSTRDYTINVKGLDGLLKALKAKPPLARVGVLNDKDTRKDSSSNAEIGAAHEYGTTRLPVRSFLRIPITEHLQAEMEVSGLLDDDILKEVIKSGSVIPWLKKVAIMAENVVFDAFDSGGDGKWPAWSDPNYTNNTGMILVDTQQLRNSITHEVKP